MAERKRMSTIALIGLSLAIVSAAAAMLAGLGTRWEWWYFRTGFTVLRWAAYGGLTAAAVSFVGLITTLARSRRGWTVVAVAGLLVALVTAGIPWMAMQTGRRVPAINDITTDTEDPPQFVAILPLRKDAPCRLYTPDRRSRPSSRRRIRT